jgi:hypothetical protein
MFRSGPFRDAYCTLGIDPRKDSKWAGYQTLIFNFRKMAKPNEEEEEQRQSHIFTGKDLNIRVVCFALCDIEDPMLRRIIDESPLRDQFHVWSY